MFAYAVIGIIIILLLTELSPILHHGVLCPHLGMPCLHTVPGTQAFSVCLCLSATPSFALGSRCTSHAWVPIQMSLGSLQGLAFHHQIVLSCQWVSSAVETSQGSLVSSLCPIIFRYFKPTYTSRTCSACEPSCPDFRHCLAFPFRQASSSDHYGTL